MARILVVDDDDDARDLIELALAGQGHDVESVGSGQSAAAEVPVGRPPFDIDVLRETVRRMLRGT